VWTMGSGHLYGFDAVSGSLRFDVAIGSHTRFATPTEDNGWVIVPETNRVDGFSFNWQSLGGVLTSDPDAAAPAATREDVFARGGDGALWHRKFDDTNWLAWKSLGGSITSDPGSVSWGAGRLDVFARGRDNALWHRTWDGINWLAWESLGGSLTSAPD